MSGNVLSCLNGAYSGKRWFYHLVRQNCTGQIDLLVWGNRCMNNISVKLLETAVLPHRL